MSFENCILSKVSEKQEKGFLTEKQAKEVISQYETLLKKYTASLGDEQAAHVAAYQFTKITSDVMAIKNQNEIVSALSQKRIKAEIDNDVAVYKDYYKGLDKIQKAFLPSPQKYYRERVHSLFETVYTRHKSLRNKYYKAIEDFIEENKTRYGGFVDNAENMPDIFRALGGEAVDNAKAREFASAIRPVLDLAIRNYKVSGGIAGYIENFLPQNIHNRRLIKRIDKETWKGSIVSRLDRENMIDFETGLPLNDEKLDSILDQIHEDISGGEESTLANYAKEGKQRTPYGGEISQRREQSRVLKFKSVDDYLEYNREFGFGDEGLFGIVANYLDSMARDTAVLQKLGPKPKALVNNLSLELQARGLSDTFTKNMFNIMTGAGYTSQISDEFYTALEGFKNLQRSAFLGGAPVAALGDSFYIGMTARINGLDATKVVGRYISFLNPKSSVDMQTARNILFINQSTMGNIVSAAKYSGDIEVQRFTAGKPVTYIEKFANFSGKAAGFVNTASGLAHMTDRGRAAVQFSFLDVLTRAHMERTPLSKMPIEVRNSAKANGITDDDWLKIISSEPQEFAEGARFITTDAVALSGNAQVASKLDDWLTSLGDTAINEPNLRARTAIAGGYFGDVRAGSANRALWSSITMFKSFVVTNMLNFVIPAIRRSAEKKSIGALGGILVGTTITGLLTLQLSELLKGREALDTTDWRTWKAATLRGGGLGILGDFMFGDESRYGHSFWTDALGPVFGSLTDATAVVKGNFDKALAPDQESNFFVDGFNFLQRHTPASTLWYARLPVERLFFDSIEEMIDPDFEEKARRRAKRLKERTGQEQWWPQE